MQEYLVNIARTDQVFIWADSPLGAMERAKARYGGRPLGVTPVSEADYVFNDYPAPPFIREGYSAKDGQERD